MKLNKVRSITLNAIKYGDNSRIVRCYTNTQGMLSFIVNGVENRKNRSNKLFLLPLSLHYVDYYFNPHTTIYRVKEITPICTYTSIPFNIIKSTVSMYMAEMLYAVLKDDEPNEVLFDFLEKKLLQFDAMHEKYSQFHLYFLVQLMIHIGKSPLLNYSSHNRFFDLQEGVFCSAKPMHFHVMDESLTPYFLQLLLSEDYPVMPEKKIAVALLEHVMLYYKLHVPGITEVKSVEVLKQVFAD